MSLPQIIIVAVLIGFSLWLVSAYNRLIALRGHLHNAFAQIDVQLRRRFDLIPNLVDVARRYMEHERGTLEAVIAARNQSLACSRDAARRPGDLGAMNALSAASGALADTLGRLMVVAESYPELKADTTMIQLSEELATTENRIAFARQAYNDSVTDFNVAIGQFPVNLVARTFGLAPSQPLQSCESALQHGTVRVQF
ncbi:MAG TPA: LemA family protein [Burkholderiaceae bacterium]|jgi:LemA protein|nr:LemA family protein [Burkholderiaceae bacterium]